MKTVVHTVLLVLAVVALTSAKSVSIPNVLREFEDLGDGSYEIVIRRRRNVELNPDVPSPSHDNFSHRQKRDADRDGSVVPRNDGFGNRILESLEGTRYKRSADRTFKMSYDISSEEDTEKTSNERSADRILENSGGISIDDSRDN